MIQRAVETPAAVLIAAVHGVLRAGLRALFARYPCLKVVGQAADGNETLRLAQELVPNLVLLDLNIRDPDGIAVTEALGHAAPAARVLMLTPAKDVELLRRALRAGACGFVVMDARESELMNAIEAVLRGDLYLDPSMTRALLAVEMGVTPAGTPRVAVAALTAREKEVIRLLCDGYTNAQIARDLCVSARTVESHRANIAQKLGTHSRADMVRLANAYAQMHPAEHTSISEQVSSP